MTDFECGDCRITAECTDQCRVVPCSDLSLCQDDAPCDGSCVAADCVECSGWDDIFQCCQDDHAYDPSSVVWTDSFSDMLCPCDTDPGIIQFQNTSQDIYHSATFGSSGTSSVSTTPSPLLSASQHTPTASVEAHACMWANCGLVFASLSELVGHVNLQHLRPPAPVPAPNITNPPFLPPQDAQLFSSDSALSCHWGNCSMYPNLSSIPGSSSGPEVDQVINLLTTHLMQDHLGVNSPLLGHPAVSSPLPDQLTVPSVPSVSPVTSPTTTAQEPTSPATPRSTPGDHPCKWQSCGQIFASSDELTAHIASVHIGSGRAHYDCFWEGCSRNGDSGFSSKQKISRHLQSHTGHRPFQCQVCQQNFSEAATLQQHMRRHTHEKPYVCDHPGCGKAFSITGALTIHKRTHNGLRPFKCSYCDKAFSESSNLSKHLRTHTGARPYVCIQPGCKKSFARPDQLARHTSVHRKKDNRT